MGAPPALIKQAAVIAVRAGRVCLITSRRRKRWVLPKGCLEVGKTAGEIALQEAWEEAGLVGWLQHEPVGSYIYEKGGHRHHVTVFWMEVTETAGAWPEREWRQRRWLRPAQVVPRLHELALRELVTKLFGAEPVTPTANELFQNGDRTLAFRGPVPVLK
jgi:8-oxo-dGTP pyrophosphatase MutT (NUDIX family)